MTKQTSQHAAAARAIRNELKRHGIAGRVTSSSYAGGSSVHVHLTDALPATIEAVESFAAQFQFGTFDGMTDSYNVSNRRDDIPQVRFVIVHADYSAEVREAVEAYAAERNIDPWRILSNQYPNDFWTSRKPRIRAA